MRYLHGQRLPNPARLGMLSRLLRVPANKLYPEYSLNLGAHYHRCRKDWWNRISEVLIQRCWTTKKFAKRCKISLRRVEMLMNWSYPPTERMLCRLEEGLCESRDIFWEDWKDQQCRHYKRPERSRYE